VGKIRYLVARCRRLAHIDGRLCFVKCLESKRLSDMLPTYMLHGFVLILHLCTILCSGKKRGSIHSQSSKPHAHTTCVRVHCTSLCMCHGCSMYCTSHHNASTARTQLSTAAQLTCIGSVLYSTVPAIRTWDSTMACGQGRTSSLYITTLAGNGGATGASCLPRM